MKALRDRTARQGAGPLDPTNTVSSEWAVAWGKKLASPALKTANLCLKQKE